MHVLYNLVRAHAKILLFHKRIIIILFNVVTNLMSFGGHIEFYRVIEYVYLT